MTKTMIEELLEGKSEPAPAGAAAPAPAAPAPAQEEDDTEPDHYRPYVIRSPRPSFAIVEAHGRRHGFAYHALRHLVHEVERGQEVLSFLADGCVVTMQGRMLLPIFHGMMRHRLWEARAYDNRQLRLDLCGDTIISGLLVQEPPERLQMMQRRA